MNEREEAIDKCTVEEDVTNGCKHKNSNSNGKANFKLARKVHEEDCDDGIEHHLKFNSNQFDEKEQERMNCVGR